MTEYPKRGDIYWVNLDPTVGSETRKTRPCLIISNNAQNKISLRVIMAPITSNTKTIYPFEAKVMVKEKEGKVMLDQIRALDKQRLGKKIASIDLLTAIDVDKALKVALALI